MVVVVVMLFAIVVQGVLFPRPRGPNNFLGGGENIFRSISFKLNKIFSPWSEDVRRNGMEERR